MCMDVLSGDYTLCFLFAVLRVISESLYQASVSNSFVCV